jgi:transcription factor AP-4
MQSINAGFQSLRTLLPHHEGEKLSKVSRTKVSEANPATVAFATTLPAL